MNLRVLVLAAAMSAAVHAQSFELLRGIQPGQTVRVTDTSGKRQTGTWKADNSGSVTFTTKQGEVSLPHDQVRKVELKSTARRVRNIAIGAGVGVALGATIDNSLGTRLRNESSGDGGRAVIYATSIAAGAALGALPSGWHTIYRVKSR